MLGKRDVLVMQNRTEGSEASDRRGRSRDWSVPASGDPQQASQAFMNTASIE